MANITVKHTPLVISGKRYDLNHLKSRTAVLRNHGKQGANIGIRISFLSHVYSKTSAGNSFDFKDENGQKRDFNVERHDKSLNLPDHCLLAISENYLTWNSKDRNNVSSYVIVNDEHNNKYAIFYRLAPSLSQNHDVEFIVKSAYPVRTIKPNRRKFNVRTLIKKCYYEGKGLP